MSEELPFKPSKKKDNAKAEIAQPARALPNALGPEKSILSSMLQDPAEYIMKAEELKLAPEHFYHPSHQTLYTIIKETSEKGEQIELVSLTQTLLDKGILENIGGPAALTEIFTYMPTAAHFEHHLNLVKEKHTLRCIIDSCTEAITRSFEDPEEVAALLDQVEQKIFAIREGTEIQDSSSIKEDVTKVIENFKKQLAGKGEPIGIKSGYSQLDRMTNGLKPGEMFVIAARPSMGKTSFVMNIIEHICLDAKLPSMFFSCEMTSEQIVQRLLFARARYAVSKLRKGFTPTKGELVAITKAAKEITEAKLFIDDTPSISISELRAKARRKKRDENIQVIAVDYLQLMKSNTRQAQNSREREIAEISAGLKALAKELEIPVIVLAQLNRGPENRDGGKPKMSDLRESGSIEQDADMIGLLYRTGYYAKNQEERDEDDGKAELNLAKNRNGETGSVFLTFLKELMRFETRAFENQ